MTPPKVLAAALTVTSALAIAQPAPAQAPVSPYPPQLTPAPTPDADALANAMRQLAASPRDLGALLTAGELSLKVGDASGAAALFRRAEQVDPMNGRVKAGMARILVTQERPGEALRYFDQAVGYGLDPRSFAGDRGLAYDLIGEGERAQRDYRLALKAGENDEVRRRYALSLGISNKQLAALEQIDPLTRRNDRGAWRARAFILAMTGDVTGANAIAGRMMPGAMAQGLGGFFARLPTLSATDKAFAVHFGEVRPTPQRIADARLVPALPVLGPDPDARVLVAAAPPPNEPRTRGARRRREAALRVQVARAAPRVTPAPAPGFGSVGESPNTPTRVAVARTPAPAAPVLVAAITRSAPAPFTRPRIEPIQQTTLADYARAAHDRSPTPTRPLATGPIVIATATPAPSVPVIRQVSAAPTPAPQPAPAAETRTVVAAAPPTPLVPAPTPAPIPSVAIVPAATPVQVAAATPITPVPSSVPTPPGASEGSILSRIVAGLTVPAYELGVGAPPLSAAQSAPATVEVAAAPRPVKTPAPVAVASAPPPKPAALVRREPAADTVKPPAVVATRAARRPVAEPVVTEPDPAPRKNRTARSLRVALADATTDAPKTPELRTRASRRKAEAEAAADPRDTGKRGAGRRASAARDDADDPAPTRRRGDRRALAAKDDDAPAKGKGKPRKPDDATATKGEPSRIWVQVAGGANESDLPKAWSAVQSKTPALRGKQAYSTPLRATNRVVTGPFKTDAEARAFINQLARQGVSAFPFTSDKGQKLAKLPPR